MVERVSTSELCSVRSLKATRGLNERWRGVRDEGEFPVHQEVSLFNCWYYFSVFMLNTRDGVAADMMVTNSKPTAHTDGLLYVLP